MLPSVMAHPVAACLGVPCLCAWLLVPCLGLRPCLLPCLFWKHKQVQSSLTRYLGLAWGAQDCTAERTIIIRKGMLVWHYLPLPNGNIELHTRGVLTLPRRGGLRHLV